jgi:hypothetical protein
MTSDDRRQLHQRCLTCGTEEAAGSFCTFCRTATYDLVIHLHREHNACPLGPYLNPGNPENRNTAATRRFDRARAAWLADPSRADAGPLIVTTWTHTRGAASPLPSAVPDGQDVLQSRSPA